MAAVNDAVNCCAVVLVEGVGGAVEFVADVEVLVVEADELLAVWVALSELCAGVFWLPEWFSTAAAVWIGWDETPSKSPAVSWEELYAKVS